MLTKSPANRTVLGSRSKFRLRRRVALSAIAAVLVSPALALEPNEKPNPSDCVSKPQEIAASACAIKWCEYYSCSKARAAKECMHKARIAAKACSIDEHVPAEVANKSSGSVK